MKRLLFIFFCLTFSLSISAQMAYKPSMDTDIWNTRNNAIPTFSYHYDDYLQYAPAAVMVGLKTFGNEGLSSWRNMIVSNAISTAVMAATVNGLKYSVGRLRPDGSRHNSFPSGHTATAFMTATMLHYEYGWKSPWYSIGGYTAAAITGVSRILNNRHWMSDVVVGAIIGTCSVRLGYAITGLIFKDGVNDSYVSPEFIKNYQPQYLSGELYAGRRFILSKGASVPERGSVTGVSVDVPVYNNLGITARAAAGSLTDKALDSYNMYNFMTGAYWSYAFGWIFDVSARALAGYARHQWSNCFDFAAGVSLGMRQEDHFFIKAFAEYETFRFNSYNPWLHSIVVGFSTGFSF